MNISWLGDCAMVIAGLLEATIKGTLLISVMFIVLGLMHRASAAKRHWVVLMVLMGVLGIPVVSWVLPGWGVWPVGVREGIREQKSQEVFTGRMAVESGGVNQESWGSQGSAGELSDRPHLNPPPPPPAYRGRTEAVGWVSWGWSQWMVLVWGVGAGVCVWPGLVCGWILRGRGRVVAGGELFERMRGVMGELGIGRRVRMVVIENGMPMVFGVFWPAVMLPAEAMGWSAQRQRGVLLHELGHIGRWDLLTRWVGVLACGVYWFNPAVWMAYWRLLAESERACDDVAIGGGNNAEDYAQQILEIASGRRTGFLGGKAAIAMARKTNLEGRLLAILDEKRNRRGVGLAMGVAAGLMGLGVVVPLGMMKAREVAAAEAKGEKAEEGKVEEKFRLAGSLEEAKGDLLMRFANGIEETRTAIENLATDPNTLKLRGLPNLPPSRNVPWVMAMDLQKLADRLNGESAVAMSEAARMYMKASGELLGDKSAGNRAMACVFLGMMKMHMVEAGLAPELASRMGDGEKAFRGVFMADMPFGVSQQALPTERRSLEVREVAVGELAKTALDMAFGARFKDAADFEGFWKSNSDYEKHLWYWALRWRTDGVMEKDLPGLFEKDAKGAVRIAFLGKISGFVNQEASRGISVYNTETARPGVLAELVVKHQVQGELLAMITGEYAMELKVEGYERSYLAQYRALPVLEAASRKGDVKELTDLLDKGAGLVGTDAGVRVGLTRVIARIDPAGAPELLRKQLARNPGFAPLAAELLRLTGEKDWAMVKRSYVKVIAPVSRDPMNLPALLPNDEKFGDGTEVIETAGIQKWMLAELLEADHLEITLNNRGLPTDDYYPATDRFRAFVRRAKLLNGNVDVVSDELVERAWASSGGKISDEQLAEIAVKNRAAVGARKVAVELLVKFFGGK